jgi:hypothetical protein
MHYISEFINHICTSGGASYKFTRCTGIQGHLKHLSTPHGIKKIKSKKGPNFRPFSNFNPMKIQITR